MSFVPFEMERWQSQHEHEVSLNLSESGVVPLDLAELRALAGISSSDLDAVLLEYIQSNGAASLRERIAALHPGAGIDSVIVTSGSSEANFIAAWELCEPGAEIVHLQPSYFQIQGLADNLGARVRNWRLDAACGWEPSAAQLDKLVNGATRAIVVTNPNNPTGRRFDERFVASVVSAAESAGAWIIADEVYRGAELDGELTTSFWGCYDRLVVTGGLSKAYGLPGLRVGWAVTSPQMAGRLWARKDYTTISASALSAWIAEVALQPAIHDRLLARTRGILNHNWPLLERWLRDRRSTFRWRAPDAGAIAFVEFDLPCTDFELVERLRVETDCLLVPGSHFDVPNAFRIGFGPRPEALADGLERLARVVDPLRAKAPQSV